MQADASGQFLFWLAAIILIGAIGYIDELAPISNALLVLVLVVLFLSNRGVFAQFTAAVQQGASSSTLASQPVISLGTSGSVSLLPGETAGPMTSILGTNASLALQGLAPL